MLSIDSSRYSVRGIGGGLVAIRDRRTGESETVSAGSIPSAAALAAMAESAFDSAMREALA